MADIIYLTLNGNKQGLISAGCSSYDSIGNRYQNNHSDEILVYSTDYDISRHQNISHAPFVFEKADDKSSALLLSSITNWDDYLSYQLWDGDDIVIIEFVIPREQAEHITKLIYELGGANALFCATRITHVLKLSGGVFSNLDTPIYIRSPWELKKQLLDIYFPERGGIISGAY
ncbi:TPA: type VI secretion system tube protein TssD [Proteus mirabilis]|nr:type VI secretion system tube protein Hcp [Proteus mirabilis]